MKMVFQFLFCIVCMVILTGCMSTKSHETTTFYDIATGKVSKVVEKETKEGWLHNKSVNLTTNGYLVEFTTAVDPTTGMIMPTIKTAGANNNIMTVPSIPFSDIRINPEATITNLDGFCNFSESFTFEKSLWGDKAALIELKRTASGSNIPDASVKMKVITILNGQAGNTTEDSITPQPTQEQMMQYMQNFFKKLEEQKKNNGNSMKLNMSVPSTSTTTDTQVAVPLSGTGCDTQGAPAVSTPIIEATPQSTTGVSSSISTDSEKKQ